MRHFRWVVPLVAAAMVLGGTAAHAAPAPGEEGFHLTLYNSNFGVVREVRRIKLPEKVATIQFRNVAVGLDPRSVRFESLTDPDGTYVLEQNYKYDLVSADKLLNKYIDREITVLDTKGKELRGTLLAHRRGGPILDTDTGIQILGWDVRRYNLDRLPEGLITKPMLVWKMRTAKPGPHLAKVTYQTFDLNWEADYIATLSPDETRMDLDGWVTLKNECGVTFPEARVKLIAGNVRGPKPKKEGYASGGGGSFGTAQERKKVEEKAFFEYHLYTLPWPITLANNETKQVQLLSAAEVPVEKEYIVMRPTAKQRGYDRKEPDPWKPRLGDMSCKVRVYVVFENKKQAHLGMALPKGKVRVYKCDQADDQAEFIGQDNIDHTPRDETARLYIGDAFDIVAERAVTDYKSGDDDHGHWWFDVSVRFRIRNHKDRAIAVRVREPLAEKSDRTWRIVKENRKHTKADASTIEYALTVPKDGQEEVTYTVHYFSYSSY